MKFLGILLALVAIGVLYFYVRTGDNPLTTAVDALRSIFKRSPPT